MSTMIGCVGGRAPSIAAKPADRATPCANHCEAVILPAVYHERTSLCLMSTRRMP
jgi:hypothetical protein